MNAKDKAIQLYELFYYKTPSILSEKNKHNTAKQCALISCDEIIASHKDELTGYNIKVQQYYQKVKTEIEKL
jgi:hypothetical protein